MFALVALNFSIATLILLQPPAPTPSELRQNKQAECAGEQQITANQNGPTQSMPTAIHQRAKDMSADDGGDQSYKDSQNAPTDWNRVVACGTIALAFFAFVQIIVYGTQAKYMKNANRQTDETLELMRLDNRPWVSIAGMNWLHPQPDAAMTCLLYITNTGKTPAHITGMRTEAFWERPRREKVRGYADALIESMKNESPSELPVAPGQKCPSPTYPSLTLTAAQIEAVHDSPKQMFFISIIQYTDTAGIGTYLTQQCIEVVPARKWHVYKYGSRMT